MLRTAASLGDRGSPTEAADRVEVIDFPFCFDSGIFVRFPRNLETVSRKLGGNSSGWQQGVTERSSLPLEFSEGGFFESKLVMTGSGSW